MKPASDASCVFSRVLLEYSEAVSRVRERGGRVGHLHLRHLNPLPPDLCAVVARYKRVLVPELNAGQLAALLRGHCLVDVHSYGKVEGQPFTVGELEEAFAAQLEEAS